MIENLGFNYDLCIEETLKEIESRKGAFNPDNRKWEKFKDEESQKLWYKANYESCKMTHDLKILAYRSLLGMYAATIIEEYQTDELKRVVV